MSAKAENRFKANSLKKAQEINSDAAMKEAMTMQRRDGNLPRSILDRAENREAPTRPQMRRWLAANAADYEGATALAEAASVYWDLPAWWLDDPDHWLWDEACLAAEEA